MKRVVIISLIQILFVSCGKYLDKYPHSGTPREHITNEDAGLLVTGMYNIAQYKPTFNGWALFDIIGGDIIRTGATSANTPKLLVEGAIAPNESIVTSPWNGYFAGLYQINSTLSVIESLVKLACGNGNAVKVVLVFKRNMVRNGVNVIFL